MKVSEGRVAPTVRIRRILDTPFSRRPAWTLPFLPLLAVLSAVVALVAAWRRRADDRLRLRMSRSSRNGKGRGSPAPHVVCVGNILAGGSGKSPVARWLAGEFLAEGREVALLSRGYGVEASGLGRSTCARADFLSSAEGASLRSHLADEVKEHLLLLGKEKGAEALERLHIVQGADRRAGLSLWRRSLHEKARVAGLDASAEDEFVRSAVAVMDDGLQHFKVHPDFRLCVWPLELFEKAPRAALPLGPYREGFFWRFPRFLLRFEAHAWSRLPVDAPEETKRAFFSRASVLSRESALLDRPDGKPPHYVVRSRAEWLFPAAEPLERDAHILRDALAAGKVALVCGLGMPEAFAASAHHAMMDIPGCAPALAAKEPPRFQLADHGVPDASFWRELSRFDVLITSAKDWCRMSEDEGFRGRARHGHLWVLCVKVHLEDLRENRVEARRFLACRDGG